MKRQLFALIAGMAVTLPCVCFAANEEIQVYLDDLSQPGQFGVDVHNNFVTSGDSTLPYPGGLAPLYQYRLTPEFYYGLTKTVELGAYLLTTKTSDGQTQFEGEKVRIKYIAPHDSDNGLFWGANLEVGRTNLYASPQAWNAELKGIAGYRSGRWTFAINPNVDWSLSKGGGPVTLDVDGKVAYKVTEKTQIGLETYNELGPLRHLQGLNQNSKTLYLALDHDFGQYDLNAGIGRGLTSDADNWVLKFIIGTHF